MLYSIGQKVPYLYKVNKEEFTVEATIITLNGAQIGIEFINPLGQHRHRRMLRTPQERARLLDREIKRPSMIGNQNAAKGVPQRDAVTLSLRDERRKLMHNRLLLQGKPVSVQSLRELAYEAIDAYLQSHSPASLT